MRDGEPALSQMLAAAAALVLRPAEAEILANLVESGGGDITLEQARQDFYDVLCVPQSGRYISPYAHVLDRGQLLEDQCWNFPPPRFDGGDALAGWYEAVDFDPLQLDVDPMLRGPHRALDQVGFILTYLGGLVGVHEVDGTNERAAAVLGVFLDEHVGDWMDRFCTLLGGCGSAYLQAVASAVEEVVELTRARYGQVPSSRYDALGAPDGGTSVCEEAR